MAGTLKVISYLGGIIATATALILCGSVAFDWAYFWAVGIKFEESPTVIADHARTGLVFLPPIVIGLFMALMLEMFIRRLEGGMTEEEIVSSAKNPERTARSRDRPYKFIYWTAITGVLMWALFGISDGLLLAFVLWLPFISWVFSHPRLGSAVSQGAFWAICFIPAIFILILTSGYVAGRSDNSTQSATHGIHLVGISLSSDPVEVQLMRTFGQWNLIRDQDGNIAWLAREDVRRIDLLQEEDTPFLGLLCWAFGGPLCQEAFR